MNELRRIVNEIRLAGGMCLEVGGTVRDEMLGIEVKDRDIEVYGMAQECLETVLKKFGKVSVVGKSFGVTKLTTAEDDYDFSMPRTDSKTGKGHKGFAVSVNSTLTPKEAASRRDYTINSIGRDALTGALYDHYNGREDIQRKLLRATSEKFVDDPLRVLRGFQFAARFEMEVETGTARMAWGIQDTYDELPKERVFGEFWKWATKGIKPSLGLKFLLDTGWISLFPELSALLDLPQDPVWHPEGSAWIHTGFVCDAMADICQRENIAEEDRVVLMLAALCHDLGKAVTTEFVDGRWRSPGHAEAGVPIADEFLQGIGCHPSIIERVLPLVAEHMVHVGSDSPSPRVVRRLAMRLGAAKINELILLIEADHGGRPPLPTGLPENAQKIKLIADELLIENDKPQPIVQGRHLIQLGMQPGPGFGPILAQLFELQLEGTFTTIDEGIQLADQIRLAS